MSRKEDEYLIERMGNLLAEIAIIVNGPEPPLTSWSYHDLPEKVRALKQAPPAAVPAPQPIVRFIDQGDGTVIDNATRLQWSKATLTPTRISQHEALKLCEGLSLGGHGDWRLPTRAELLPLVDDTRHQPAINVDAFPDTKNDWYWTSTVCAWSSARAWLVLFGYGFCDSDGRGSSGGLVRAVRSVPAGYALVPVEPTEAMLDAGHARVNKNTVTIDAARGAK